MEAATPRAARAAWYGLVVLTLINMFAQMDRISVAILLEPIKADLHLNDQELGLLSGLAFALFYAILGLPLARYADRSSRTRLLSGCLMLWTLMTTVSGYARTFPQLFLARVGVGVGEAGCLPASHSLIGDWFPRTQRSFAVAIFQCGSAIGISIGTLVVGLLAHYLGWRTCLQLIGIAGIPLAVLVFLTVREPARPEPLEKVGEPARQALGALLHRRAFVHLALAYSISAIANLGLGQWNPTFLMRSFGLTMAQVGTWAGIATAVGSILGLLAGGFFASRLARLDARWEIWIPTIATATAFPIHLMLALSPNVWMALTCKVVNAVVASVAQGVAIAAVQGLVEPHRRATAIALMLFLNSLLGLGLGPYLVGLASDLLTPSFGRESLRYGLLLVSVALPWATVHYALAGRASSRTSLN